MMGQVITAGTARRADLGYTPVAGKTGTARKHVEGVGYVSGRYIASFMGYFPVENPVEVHDFHATLLHLLGIDHKKLTFKYQGRDFRLTDVAGNVITDIVKG